MNIKKLVNLGVATVFAISMAILPISMPKVYAAGVSCYGLTVADTMNGASGADYLISVSSASGVPASGSVEITFPAGFSVGSANIDFNGYPEGPTQRAGQTISAQASSNIPANFSLTVSNVVNGSAGDYSVSLVIKDAGGAQIDSGTASLHIVGDITHFEILPTSPISKTAGQNFTITVKAKSGDDMAYTANAVTLTSNPSDSGLSVGSFNLTENGYAVLNVFMTKAGTYTITASESGKSGSSNTVSIAHASTNSVSISPTSATINKGATKQFTATAYDAYGNGWNVTSSASWSTNGGSVSAGLYTGTKAGTYNVIASIDGKSATAQIKVNETQTGGGTEQNQGGTTYTAPVQSGSQAASEQTATTSKVTPKTTAKETARTQETVTSQKEEPKQSSRTVEKVVLAIVALALLGTSAYFLFKKSPEDELDGGKGDAGDIKITPAEEIIKKAEEAAKKSAEQKIKEEHEKKVKK
jgi:hypothetical protein